MFKILPKNFSDFARISCLVHLFLVLAVTGSFAVVSAKPTNTKIVSVSTDTVTVEWKEKSNGVVNFTVFAATSSTFNSVISSVTLADSSSDVNKITTATIDHLTPNTLYWVCVRGKSQGKDLSACSAADSAYSLTLPPSGAHVLGVHVSSVVVGWDLPATADGFELRSSAGDPTLGGPAPAQRSGTYRVPEGREASPEALRRGATDADFGSFVSSKTTNGALRVLTLKNLNPDTTYYLRLGSINGDGVVNFSMDPMIAKTNFVLGPPPETPTRTRVVAVSSVSFVVSWKEKNTGSLSYHVIAATDEFNLNNSIVSWVDFRDEQSDINKIATVTIGGLIPNHRYWVAARAARARSLLGNYSSPDEAVTLAKEPTEFSVTPVNDRDYWIRWNSGGNSPDTIYELSQSMDNFQNFVSTIVPWTANFKDSQLLFRGLLPGVIYSLRVRARNQEGIVTAYANLAIVPAGGVGFLIGAIAGGRKTGLQLEGGKTSLNFSANAFNKDAIVVVSTDPLHHPIRLNSDRLSQTLRKLKDKRFLKSTLREFSAMLAEEEFQGNFNASVELSISYAEEDANNDGLMDNADSPISIEQLALWHVDEQTEMITLCPDSKVDRSLQRVSCNPKHFSTYVVLADLTPKAAAIGEAFSYPVPWRPNDNDPANGTSAGITFANVPANGEIKIFTVNGDWVRTLYLGGASTVIWDGRNDRGDYAASGVYLWHLKGDAVSKTGKLIVVR